MRNATIYKLFVHWQIGRKGGTMKQSQPSKIKMVTIPIIRQIKIMTKHVSDINKQSSIFPGEWLPDKNLHHGFNNDKKSHTVLFRISDMVEAIAHVPFLMHKYHCTLNRSL